MHLFVPDVVSNLRQLFIDRFVMGAVRAEVGIQHFILDPQPGTLFGRLDSNHTFVRIEGEFDTRCHNVTADQ